MRTETSTNSRGQQLPVFPTLALAGDTLSNDTHRDTEIKPKTQRWKGCRPPMPPSNDQGTEATPSPRQTIRRFDVFAEYTAIVPGSV